MRFFVFLIITTLSISCKPLKNIEISNNTKNNTPQIVFLYFNAIKVNDSIIKIQLNKTKKVDGKLKQLFLSKIPSEKLKNKYWLVNFNDHNNQIIQLQIHNPLTEEIEFINKQGKFEKKTINHTEKLFVIRVPFNSSIKNITFEQIITDKQGIKTVFIDKIDI